jgi:hypothetical protein
MARGTARSTFVGSITRFRSIRSVANANGLSAAARQSVRESVRATLSYARTELSGAEAALDGPDPEYAVYLLLHFLSSGFPNALRTLDRALSAARRVA